MEYLESVRDFIYENWLTIAVGLLGLATSVSLYFKGKKSRIPTYVIRTINLVQENVKKINTVEILYSKKKVQNLSISKIAFWNDGREPIKYKDDVPQKDTVRLVIENEYKFLDAKIIYQKNPANNFHIKISNDKKKINIYFDYCDFEQGVVIQVFHTGSYSKDIHMEGSITTVDKIYRKELSFFPLPQKLIEIMKHNNKSRDFIQKTTQKFSALVILILGIITMLFGLFMPFMKNVTKIIVEVPEKTPSGNTQIIITMITLIVVGALYTFLGYNLIRRRIPKGFNIFNEEF